MMKLLNYSCLFPDWLLQKIKGKKLRCIPYTLTPETRLSSALEGEIIISGSMIKEKLSR